METTGKKFSWVNAVQWISVWPMLI